MATTAKNEKYAYSFGGGKADGNEWMKNLLGGKVQLSRNGRSQRS